MKVTCEGDAIENACSIRYMVLQKPPKVFQSIATSMLHRYV
jgi:hypothetical protein